MDFFKCEKCGKEVASGGNIGTANRNHCPTCLWSKHLDEKGSGDRASKCLGVMEPVGLTFKKEGVDKYGKERQGEIMLIHKCQRCEKISINRLAGDDQTEEIMKLFEESKTQKIEISKDIRILSEEDREEIRSQLFGRNRVG